MIDLYIFGTKNNSEMAKFYFERDCPQYKIKGFVEDAPQSDVAYNLPVFPSSKFLNTNSLINCLLSAPLTSSSGRKRVFEKFKSKGYSFATYISPKANIWSSEAIGENCFIQEDNNIQFATHIGDNCLFWAGNHIGHHGNIQKHNTFTSHVVLSGGCEVGELCYFGVNSTIADGVKISGSAFIGMGALVTKNIEEEGLYVGAPARRIKSSKEYL
jgi:sugar O-acyltransferase (sialic acid O-acetyltransferase NeuD family)